MEQITVDARGLSCPQPVIEAMNGLKEYPEGHFRILVDNQTAVENISRFLTNSKHMFSVREEGRDFIFEVK